MARQRIGETLVELGVLRPVDVSKVLHHQQQARLPFGHAAVASGACTTEQVLEGFSHQLKLPSIDLTELDLASLDRAPFPQRLAEKWQAVPLETLGGRYKTLVVAMAAPATIEAQDQLRAYADCPRIEVFLADDAALRDGIIRRYHPRPPVLGSDAAPTVIAHVAQPSFLDDLGAEALKTLTHIAGLRGVSRTLALHRLAAQLRP